MATVTEELVYEYWDCDKCGQKAIRGDVRTCPSCGNARNENIKFYLKEGKEEKVEDKALADKFKAGADWLCSFCETLTTVYPAVPLRNRAKRITLKSKRKKN